MKKILLITLLLACLHSYSQTIQQTATFYSSGKVGKIRNDTIYPLPRTPLQYWNGYGKFVNLVDSIPYAFSASAGTIYYSNGTKLVALAPGNANQVLHSGTTPVWKDTAASGGAGTLLVGDTSYLYLRADAFSFTNFLTTNKKGIYLTDYTNGKHDAPPIYWRSVANYLTTPKWSRLRNYVDENGGISAAWAFEQSSDSSTWSPILTMDLNNGFVFGGKGTFASSITSTSQSIFTAKAAMSLTGQFFSGVANQSYDQLSSFRGVGNFGITPNNLSTANRFQVTNGIMTVAIVNGGTGGTNGSYANIPTVVSGVGTITANLNYIISGGVITSVSNPSTSNIGNNFYIGDTIAINQHGLTGTKIVVRSIYGQSACGVMMTDTTTGINKLYRFDCGLKKQVPLLDSQVVSGNLTTSNAGTLTLVAGNDYIFTGTTATYTLPAISTTAIGRSNIIYIKNAGSGSITLNSASGSTIYTSSAQSTLAIAAGDGIALLPDGTYYNVMFNNAIL